MAASIKVASEKIGKALRSASPVLGAMLAPVPFVWLLSGSFNESQQRPGSETALWQKSSGTLEIARSAFSIPTGFTQHQASNINNNPDDLHPEFKFKLMEVMNRLEEKGHRFQLLETLRSEARQNALYEQGRNPEKPGAVVTSARANESAHQFGLAADLAPVIEGTVSLDTNNPQTLRAFEALGREAQAQGLVWGGHWKMLDWGHVEMRSISFGNR
jgi:hypothetical protein